MMFGQKNVLVIWVSRSSLEIMGGKIEEPERMVFGEGVIANLEVVNRDAVYAQIKEWTQKRALKEMQIVWIFGQDVFFERVVPVHEKEQDEAEIVRFLELLPFEEVDSRVYVTSESRRVVAVNRKLYKTLKTGFALQGYQTKAEISASLLDEKLVPNRKMSKEVYLQIVTHLSDIVKKRLVEPEPVSADSSAKEESKTKSYLPILVGTFMALLVALILMAT